MLLSLHKDGVMRCSLHASLGEWFEKGPNVTECKLAALGRALQLEGCDSHSPRQRWQGGRRSTRM